MSEEMQMKNSIIEQIKIIVDNDRYLRCLIALAASGCAFLATLTVGGVFILNKFEKENN